MKAHVLRLRYLRQVDLPGIHSKFIEAQRGVLAELLDLALSTGAIDSAASGSAQFARRYGFRDKPLRVRLRFLDPAHPAWVPGTDADVTLSHEAFGKLAPDARRVFITENEINFRAFPPAARSLVVFGAGDGFDALAPAARRAAASGTGAHRLRTCGAGGGCAPHARAMTPSLGSSASTGSRLQITGSSTTEISIVQAVAVTL